MLLKSAMVKRLGSILLILALLFSLVPLTVSADTWDTAQRDKATNTAYISEKSARWVDEGNFLAELTLAVNGTQVLSPLDVIIVLDRSGSMDMNYVQPSTTGEYLTFASCPCLNQNHFYLAPTGETHAATWRPDTTELIYNPSAETLTVYNGQKNVWVELDAARPIHLYYEFNDSTLPYTPYHFKMNGSDFVRISKWDTTDVRITGHVNAKGLWDHADEGMGCYDRFIEAKGAIKAFSKTLVAAHPDNKVALIPFSIRDESIVPYLNAYNLTSNNLKQRLINGTNKDAYFPAASGVTETGGVLSGTYKTIVGLTRNTDEIEETLDRLFTTPNTDYIYGLSKAYNMLGERSTQDKEDKRAVVVFLSDGKPYSKNATVSVNYSGVTTIMSFYNHDPHIYTIANAIKSTDAVVQMTDVSGDSAFWTRSNPLRHDIDQSKFVWDSSNTTVLGVPGMGAQLVPIGYMLDAPDSYDRLANMASSTESFIKVTGEQDTSAGYLSEQLLAAAIFPGGRNAVLRDKISKYFYVPDDVTLPPGVTLEGSIASGQTLVWTIGDIFKYDKPDEPHITVPLVLREQYRNVNSITFYPTNEDVPEPPLTDAAPGPDGPDTGSKLYYDDPSDNFRYDTIGTPKLPVQPGAMAHLTILKQDGNTPLSGAFFNLSKNGSPVQDLGTVATGQTGGIIFNLPNPAAGSYTLKETKAPNGYDRHDYDITFTVDQAGNISNLRYNGVVNEAVAKLAGDVLVIYNSPSSNNDDKTPEEPTTPPEEPTTPPGEEGVGPEEPKKYPEPTEPVNPGERYSTEIPENLIPEGYMPVKKIDEDGDEYWTIEPIPVPLGSLPQTGEFSPLPFLLLSMVGALIYAKYWLKKGKHCR